MKTCHYDFESRLAGTQLYPAEGFLGIHVLVGLAWLLGQAVARRARGLALFVPFAAMALLFVEFVAAHAGFAWRYAADFMPLIAIACVQYVRALPASANRFLGARLAALLATLGVLAYARHVLPARETIETAGPRELATMERDFLASRWGTDAPMPSRLTCDAPPDGPYENGAGWAPDCTVDTFTNVYLALPEKADGRSTLRMEAPGMAAETLRVYVDGRIYQARREGDAYRAELDLRRDAMHSPVVMATVEWTREATPPAGALLSIEIV
jgi:hypothetical protein